MATNWAVEELGGGEFGDKRLSKRLIQIANTFSQRSEQSIPAISKTWGDAIAAYRFFDNENVSPDAILAPHIEKTKERIKAQQVVLCLQDTSEIDYSSKTDIIGIGPLNSEKHRGFLLHPTIAITPNREMLGIIEGKMYVRESIGDKESHKERPIEEKESIRWLDSFEKVDGIAREYPNTLLVNIADREGDIYELFQETDGVRNDAGAHWLIRAAYDRKVDKNEKLWQKMEKQVVCGNIEFDFAKRGSTSSRMVTQELRIAKITLTGSKRIGGNLSPIEVTAVLAKEINPPKGSTPVEWLLLTSLPVYGSNWASILMSWYLCRWEIEIFFKVLKSGCTIEKLQLEHITRLFNCITVYMIVAWRLMYIKAQGLARPEEDCRLIFTEAEWQSVYCVANKTRDLPDRPPTIYQMVILIARLGGFLARKKDGYPGVKTLWIGLQRMADLSIAWSCK